MFLKEDKEEFKKQILEAYCFGKPSTIFAQLIRKLGIDMGIILVDEFVGKAISIPTRNSLKRAALPKTIKDELRGLEPNSNAFKLRVKNLSKFYGLRKKAILKMDKTGKYVR